MNIYIAHQIIKALSNPCMPQNAVKLVYTFTNLDIPWLGLSYNTRHYSNIMHILVGICHVKTDAKLLSVLLCVNKFKNLVRRFGTIYNPDTGCDRLKITSKLTFWRMAL